MVNTATLWEKSVVIKKQNIYYYFETSMGSHKSIWKIQELILCWIFPMILKHLLSNSKFNRGVFFNNIDSTGRSLTLLLLLALTTGSLFMVAFSYIYFILRKFKKNASHFF